ncbi:MAG: XdhC family protein [Gammaproteobacteria bacterium]|nr:MAG: XdhC family protein [Gammaproteobacteria bacterium]
MARYSTDREVMQTAVHWLEEGHRPLLVTVARTWGSSPRPAGSLMLMREDGQLVGSVTGGCVEEDLMTRYRSQQLGDTFPTIIDYGINRAEASRLGLPCGGRLELLIEQLDSNAHLQALLGKIKENELVMRRVCLTTGEASLHPASAGDDLYYTDEYLKKTFGPRWQILLIGAGHLSEYVAQLAMMMNYSVVVCDPREGNIDHSAFDDCMVVNCMPDDAVQAYATHTRSIVVALTHDPKLDDMALLDALSSPAFYVGAIGSKLNCDKRRERLKTLGISASQLQRLHAPVGLSIGSHTPPEIAVSIMAEITALRYQAKQNTQQPVNAA